MQLGNNRITLLISGNQFRSAGFQPIITTGQFILQLSYQGYPGMDKAQYYYVLKINNDYTQYTLVHNRITSADGVRNTMLKLSVAIPAGFQLQNGVSVLTLLDEIRDAFTTLYMEPTLGVEGGYTYKREAPDKSIFEEILSRYPLEPTYVRQCVNIGSRPGILLISREQTEMLFRDAQYPEFRNYEEIVVSNEADCSFYEGYIINKLHNGMGIQIPIDRRFRLFINNREWPWPVADPFNERTVISHTKVYELDPNTYEEEITSFNINELLNGTGPSNVIIDVENQVVSCTINKPSQLNRPKPQNRPTSANRPTPPPPQNPVPQPKELKLSIKILNSPIDVPSFPATLLIESPATQPRQYAVEFSRRGGYYFCETILDNSLSNQQVMIKVISNGILEMFNPIKRMLNDNSNALSVEFKKYFKTTSSFATTINRNKTPILAIGSFIIAALIGGIIYLGIKGNHDNPVKPEPKDPIASNNQKSLIDSIKQPDSPADFIKASEKALADEELALETVNIIHSEYQKWKNDTVYKKEIKPSVDSLFNLKIDAYKDLVEAIRADGYGKLKRYANENGQESLIFKEMAPIHQEFLRKFCVNFEGKYKKDERNTIYNEYKDRIERFKDFETLFETIIKAESESKDPDPNQGQKNRDDKQQPPNPQDNNGQPQGQDINKQNGLAGPE